MTAELPSIELTSYTEFVVKFGRGEFGDQRFGQAFYNHFDLHKMSEQTKLGALYERDGAEARRLIFLIFNIH